MSGSSGDDDRQHKAGLVKSVNSARQIRRFSAVLDAYPLGFVGNRLNLLFIEDAEPIWEAESYLKRLDDLSLMEERREYLIDEHSRWPFPRIRLRERPDPWVVSDRLFHDFERAQDLLLTQEDIGRVLETRARQIEATIVALVIVDGLSYYDLPEGTEALPCLVKGISNTQYGYRAVVGRPSISRRLFSLGYVDQAAFTYYPPERGGVAADIHDTLSKSQVVRVRAFDEVLEKLDRTEVTRGYIQITLAGLDQICHAHHDRPPREHYLTEILHRFEALMECLDRKADRVLACLTADHGILWRDDVEGQVRIARDLFREDIRSPRYIKGSIHRVYGKRCRSLGQNFTLLKAPWMTRRFRSNEWGVHGGISAWESLVPLIIRTS
jgi:hypothetical protein